MMVPELVTNTFVVLFVVACVWLCYVIIYADMSYDSINDNFEFYKARLSLLGIHFDQLPGNRDDAPCCARYEFRGDRIRVHCGTIKTLKIIKKLMKGTMKAQDLESMSIWPSCKLPI